MRLPSNKYKTKSLKWINPKYCKTTNKSTAGLPGNNVGKRGTSVSKEKLEKHK